MVFFSRFMVGSCTVEDFTAVRSMGVDMKWMLRCGAVSLEFFQAICDCQALTLNIRISGLCVGE